MELTEEQTPEISTKKTLSRSDVINSSLPCPFCGEKPTVDKSYLPATVEITCNNHNCHAMPSVYESVQCVENKGNTVTYSPMFEWHWQSVLDKWNTRHCLEPSHKRDNDKPVCDHSWMNKGISVQGKSLMVCTRCRETKPNGE